MLEDDQNRDEMETKYGDESTRGSSVRNYNGREIGGFRVLCNGTCTMAKSCSFSVLTWVLIVAPTLMQFIFINPVFKDFQWLI